MFIAICNVFSATVCLQVMARISTLRTRFRNGVSRYLNPSNDDEALVYGLFHLDSHGNLPSQAELIRRAEILLEDDSFLHSGHLDDNVCILFLLYKTHCY